MTPTTKILLPLLLTATLALYGCGDKDADNGGGGGSGDDGAGSTTEPEGTNAGECTDGADNDGDGDFDCNDSDCAGSPDCSEANTPGGCSDGADNDQDGLFDCDDPDCVGDPVCGDGIEGNDAGECDDGVDNDGDGLTDCEDDDCAGFEGCDDYEGDEPGECTDGVDNDSDGLTDCDDEGCAGSPDCEEPVVDADGDGVPVNEDCDDDLDTITTWDNTFESAVLGSAEKQWTYSYLLAPWGGDSTYSSGSGVLNDGFESYYGDGLVDPDIDWTPYWAWWNSNEGPSISIGLPVPGLVVTEVGVHLSHGNGGGIHAPSSGIAYHRNDATEIWTQIGGEVIDPAIGWASIPVVQLSAGGELKIDLVSAGEHTIISELSITGSCSNL